MRALEAAKKADPRQAQDWDWEKIRLWRRRETLILLRAIGELLQRVLREQIRERPVIGSWTALIDYLQAGAAPTSRPSSSGSCSSTARTS